ncbi:hypothetical protein PHMEG_00010743, partial [Phytophthora megakarya]
SAAGFVVPPVFILLEQTVSLEVFLGLGVPGAAVTTAEPGFMNLLLFSSWLQFFASAVLSPIRRPLVLIMDGCGSRFSLHIVRVAAACQIKLVCLPSNATHLFQPLDVAVFSSLKTNLNSALELLMNDSDDCNVSKEKAIKCNFSTNIKAGFRACGLYPLSLHRMTECLHHFRRNRAPRVAKIAAWLKIRTVVQNDLLVNPQFIQAFATCYRYVVLPKKFDNAHWCIILVDIDSREKKIYQFDSLQSDRFYERLNDYCESYIKLARYDGYDLRQAIDLKQTDVQNCGTLSIVFVMMQVKGEQTPIINSGNLQSLRFTLFLQGLRVTHPFFWPCMLLHTDFKNGSGM